MKARIVSLITLIFIGVGINSFAQDSRSNQKGQREQSNQRGQTNQRSQSNQRSQRFETEQRRQLGQTEQNSKKYQGAQFGGRSQQNVQDNKRNNSRNQGDYQRGQIQRMSPQEREGLRRNDRKYHYRNGGYYDHNNRYIGLEPPIGYRFRSLPLGYRIIRDAAGLFYYYRGIFYMMNNDYDEYEVVDPPIGAIVYDLPYGAVRVLIDGRIYYQYNGILYRRVNTRNGRAYRVEGKLADDQYDQYDGY